MATELQVFVLIRMRVRDKRFTRTN